MVPLQLGQEEIKQSSAQIPTEQCQIKSTAKLLLFDLQ
jgi:hypothetical protein